MIICICNNISDKTIDSVLDNKISKGERIDSIEGLQKELSVCNNCGSCYCALKEILEKKNGYQIKEPELESLFDNFNITRNK